MYGDEDPDDLPKSPFVVYLAEGDKLYTSGEFQKALDSYKIALDLEPANVTGLVARSKCYLQIGDAQAALQDAEASLKENENYHRGLYQKAEALYQMGEFEYALVFYHRGHKVRPELQEFRLGIQKAQEAIDNCVGSPSSVKLENKGDLSFFNKMDESKKPKPRLSYKPATKGTTAAKTTRTAKTKSGTSNRTAKVLLGELYADKEYLEKLLRDEDLVKGTAGGMSIYDLVTSGISYLDTRTEFWRQQKPMYARKRDRMLMQQKWSHKSSFSRSTAAASDPTSFILKNLEEIDQNLAEGQAASSLQLATSTLQAVEKLSEKEMPNKIDVVANLHSCIGNASLELGQTEKALKHHMKDLELAKKHKILDAKSRALDNLGRVYARVGSFKKAIKCWEEKIPLSKSALENTWLFHEIGRCYLEIGENVEEAREYGQRSFSEAKKAEDQVWELNAGVLIAQANVKLDQYESAIKSFEGALKTARQLEDTDAQIAITKALDDVREKFKSSSSIDGRTESSKSTKELMQSKQDHNIEKNECKSEAESKSTLKEAESAVYGSNIDSTDQESKDSQKENASFIKSTESDKELKLVDSARSESQVSNKYSKESFKSNMTVSDKKSSASIDKSVASNKEIEDDIKDENKNSEEKQIYDSESNSSHKLKDSHEESKSLKKNSEASKNQLIDIDGENKETSQNIPDYFNSKNNLIEETKLSENEEDLNSDRDAEKKSEEQSLGEDKSVEERQEVIEKDDQEVTEKILTAVDEKNSDLIQFSE